jgi:hypothetical protein
MQRDPCEDFNMNRLFYCRSCKLRFQEKNFGHGYPERDAAGLALCTYCKGPMEESLSEKFPEDWEEERPQAVLVVNQAD